MTYCMSKAHGKFDFPIRDRIATPFYGRTWAYITGLFENFICYTVNVCAILNPRLVG